MLAYPADSITFIVDVDDPTRKSPRGNMESTKKRPLGYFRSLAPGRQDALFAAFVASIVCLICSAWFPTYLRSAPQSAAVFVAVTLYLMLGNALLGVWFLYSERSILFRVLVGISVGLASVLIHSLSLHYATLSSERIRSDNVFRVFLAFLLTRVVMLTLLTILGIVLRATSGWRVILQNDSLDIAPKRQRLSIASILLLTSVVAAAIAFRERVVEQLDARLSFDFGLPPRSVFDTWDLISVAVPLEVSALLLLLLPIWLATFSGWARQRLALFVWRLLSALGLIAAVSLFVVSPAANAGTAIVLGLLAICISTAIAASIWAVTAYGFQFSHVRREDVWSPAAPTLRPRGWSGWVVGAGLLLGLFLAATFTEPSMLIASGSFSQARSYKLISNELGAPYDGINEQWRIAGQAQRRNVKCYQQPPSFQPAIIGSGDPTPFILHLDVGGPI